jgi:hypothetical protein
MTQFSIWSSQGVLEALLDSSARTIPALSPDEFSIEALHEAVILLEDLTGVEMNARLETYGRGKPVLRRTAGSGRHHNMDVGDGCYVDAWMDKADVGSREYLDTRRAAVAFCELSQEQLAQIAESLDPERMTRCRMTLTVNPRPRLIPG